MGWWIALDVLLWAAAVALFILSWTAVNFMFFIYGLICLVLAIVLLSILVHKSGANLADVIFEIFD